eukprot:1689155-Rhodomonas_salina.3
MDECGEGITLRLCSFGRWRSEEKMSIAATAKEASQYQTTAAESRASQYKTAHGEHAGHSEVKLPALSPIPLQLMLKSVRFERRRREGERESSERRGRCRTGIRKRTASVPDVL